MEELQSAIRYVVIIVATVAAIVLGDYLGYKVGRKKLVWTAIVVALLAIIVFAVYAAVVLLG
jgi:ethanolamine transporter EutH